MDKAEKAIIYNKLVRVNNQMIKDFGGTSDKWTAIIQSTDVYQQILDTKTKMYLEGTIYLCDCLIGELRQRGIL